MVLKEVEYKELVENSYNPRKRFDDAEMVELTESIKKVGLLEPLVVRKKDGKFEVVCGVRRYKALGLINNGKKIPVNVVDVDDHQAMILSFTENFERSDFTPIEEARFFAKALNMKDDQIWSGSRNSQQIQALSQEIPSSPSTIENRLKLLILPSEVQIMIEQGDILLGVAELISRLRVIVDKDQRERKMLRLAQDFSGKEPNIGKLKQEVETIKEDFETQQTKKGKELKEYEKAVEQKRHVLEENLKGTIAWYNKTFNKDAKYNLEDVSELITLLQEKGHSLTTDSTFEKLTKQQVRAESKRDRLLSNLKIVKSEHLDKCPFCGAFVSASVVNRNVIKLDSEIDQLSKEKRELSTLAHDIESMREDLRKANMDYENALDKLQSLSGEDKDD